MVLRAPPPLSQPACQRIRRPSPSLSLPAVCLIPASQPRKDSWAKNCGQNTQAAGGQEISAPPSSWPPTLPPHLSLHPHHPRQTAGIPVVQAPPPFQTQPSWCSSPHLPSHLPSPPRLCAGHVRNRVPAECVTHSSFQSQEIQDSQGSQ